MILKRSLLIVGLGNPGANYIHTRHNLGAIWVKKLCTEYNASLHLNGKLTAHIAHLNSDTVCMIPNDYMNHSGFAVQKVYKYYKYDIENIVVVHDELDLAPGDIRFKLYGGHGGHNGLRHIIEQLQTNHFKRIRIGIGHPKIPEQVADYVLSPANKSEQLTINAAIENSLQIIPNLLTHNWQQVMQFLHQPKISGVQ